MRGIHSAAQTAQLGYMGQPLLRKLRDVVIQCNIFYSGGLSLMLDRANTAYGAFDI